MESTLTAIAANADRVEWTGSREGAPGPGSKQPDGKYRLYGTVLRVSRSDSSSVKVKWDNERVTIERNANLTRA